jgi:hypothetical protein
MELRFQKTSKVTAMNTIRMCKHMTCNLKTTNDGTNGNHRIQDAGELHTHFYEYLTLTEHRTFWILFIMVHYEQQGSHEQQMQTCKLLISRQPPGTKPLKRKSPCAEEGPLPKRRDFGLKRGTKKGSMPHFLEEQAAERANGMTHALLPATPAAADQPIIRAMEAAPAEEPNTEQTRLVKKAREDLAKKNALHEEIIQPQSKALKKKLEDYMRKEKQHERRSWGAPVSFDLQVSAGRTIDTSKTMFFAETKLDRCIFRHFKQPLLEVHKNKVQDPEVHRECVEFIRQPCKKAC